MKYVPAADVSTVPEMLMFAEISPSILSVAIAPSSVYTSPTFKLIVAAPLSVITGGKSSIGIMTFTVLVSCVAAFPAASLTL